jgi:hypothetical protein
VHVSWHCHIIRDSCSSRCSPAVVVMACHTTVADAAVLGACRPLPPTRHTLLLRPQPIRALGLCTTRQGMRMTLVKGQGTTAGKSLLM